VPTDLLRMPMPKLTYINLPWNWELTEELVDLMAQNVPQLLLLSVSREADGSSHIVLLESYHILLSLRGRHRP
jgi:hypothetical protein